MLTNGSWSTHSPAESDWHQATARERSLLELRLA